MAFESPKYDPPRWIATPESLALLVEDLLAAGIYAVDTEFHRESSYFPELALVQFGWIQNGKTASALVDPLAVSLAPLVKLFSSEAVAYVHAGAQDLQILQTACGATPPRLFDTQVAASFLGHEQASFAGLVEQYVGVTLSKGAQLSDWKVRPLPASSVTYAQADVVHLLALVVAVEAELRRVGRLEWAREECRRLAERDHSLGPLAHSWWRLKGKTKFRGSARGVAQSVAAWREELARSKNRPPGTLMSDVTLLGLIAKAPTTAAELRGIRGTQDWKQEWVEEALQRIADGAKLTPGELALPPRPPGMTMNPGVLSLLQTWTMEVATRESIASSMLATRDDIAAFARGEGKVASGWRSELFGRDLTLILQGKASVAIRHGTLVLLPV